MNIKKILKSKELRYGSLSVVFIASFVALIIGLNLILTTIATKVNLTIDLTQEKLYSVGEESKTVLGTLGDDLNVTIFFLADRDLYEADKKSLMVRDLGEQYASLYPDKIKVEYKDIDQDPTFVEEFRTETQTSISADFIIVKGNFHSRVLALDSFFVKNENDEYYAFDGELRFTAAILQSSIKEAQVVTFTTGHDETTSESLLNIFAEAGFELQFKDLSMEDIDERTRILIISNPKYDFTGFVGSNPNEITEIDKVEEFLNKFNNLIMFVDSSTPEMTNLQEYLNNYWGIGYKPMHKLIDTTHAVGTGGDDGYSIVGKYVNADDETTASYNIHKVASSMGSGAKTVFRDAVELYSDVDKAENNVTIESTMETYETAESIFEGNKVAGVYPLMLLSTTFDYGENNVYKYQYVMLVSSTTFASDTFLTNQFGNSKLVLGAARVMSIERVIPDIDYKPFVDQAINIELGLANVLTWLVTAILPLIIIIIGMVVFFKRRHL